MNKTESKRHIKFAVLASDVALFTIKDNELLVRTIPVNRPPHFKNMRGLPGGLLLPHETAEEAAIRFIEDKTGIKTKNKVHLEQLYTFSEIDRDPRGRVVAVAYIAFVAWENLSESEKNDFEGSTWRLVSGVSRLAYDHDKILSLAVMRLRSRIRYTTLISKLMAKEFTLTELEHAYESILHEYLDKRNFRKKILKLKILKKLPIKRSGGRARPASLFEFKSPKVTEIEIL